LYSSKRIYEMTIKNETSYLWKKLLTAKDFSTALTFATKQYQKDKVSLDQVAFYFFRNCFFFFFFIIDIRITHYINMEKA
jgi:hypothetical protein